MRGRIEVAGRGQQGSTVDPIITPSRASGPIDRQVGCSTFYTAFLSLIGFASLWPGWRSQTPRKKQEDGVFKPEGVTQRGSGFDDDE